MNQITGSLLDIALSLNLSAVAEDCYARYLALARQVTPCDVAVLLSLHDGVLQRVASTGMSFEAGGQSFVVGEHPRLAILCQSRDPVWFGRDAAVPDPFQPFLLEDGRSLGRNPRWLGCPLLVEGRVVGVFMAYDPASMDGLTWDRRVGALFGAAVHVGRTQVSSSKQRVRQQQLIRALLRAETDRAGALLGTSPPLVKLRQEIADAAGCPRPCLIQGECGVGKGLVAYAVHSQSRRADGPMIKLDCASFSAAAPDSFWVGQPSEAVVALADKVAIATGGTFFLDEVAALPLAVQPVLLRMLQEGEPQAEVRVIATSNRDLAAECRDGRFHPGLYQYLNGYPVIVPALRDRMSDLPILTRHFAREQQHVLGLSEVVVPTETLELLAGYVWPGNIRELKHLVARAVVCGRGRQAGPRLLLKPQFFEGLVRRKADRKGRGRPLQAAPAFAQGSLRERVDAFQRDCIQRAVAEHGGNWSRAAEALGLNRANLHHLAKRLGLK